MIATPCRHGPPLSHPIVGDVIGFTLIHDGRVLWISGDTVLYDGVRGMRAGGTIDVALVHLGGVQFPVTGPLRYTMTAREAIELVGLLEAGGRGPDPLRGLVALQAGPRGDRGRRWPPPRRASATASDGCRSGSPSSSELAVHSPRISGVMTTGVDGS